MNKRGRKEKVYPQEEIDKIIYDFAEKYKIVGNIKYSEVYQYALELYQQGSIPYKLSEDFWRKPLRQGRQSIDKFNSVIKQSIISANDKAVSIINVEDVVYKHHKNLDKLIKYLKPLEVELSKSIEKEIKSRETIKELEMALSQEKQKRQELQKLVDKLQDILFQMFEYSANDEVPLVNMLRTGKSRHAIVENALSKIFNNPDDFYTLFEERRKDEGNVVRLQDKVQSKSKTLADDYGFL